MEEVPLRNERKKTAAQRREQRRRAECRVIGWLLWAINAPPHRGHQASKLSTALQHVLQPGAQEKNVSVPVHVDQQGNDKQLGSDLASAPTDEVHVQAPAPKEENPASVQATVHHEPAEDMGTSDVQNSSSPLLERTEAAAAEPKSEVKKTKRKATANEADDQLLQEAIEVADREREAAIVTAQSALALLPDPLKVGPCGHDLIACTSLQPVTCEHCGQTRRDVNEPMMSCRGGKACGFSLCHICTAKLLAKNKPATRIDLVEEEDVKVTKNAHRKKKKR